MKSVFIADGHILAHVAPFTGAWIEIKMITAVKTPKMVAPFTGAWIEITCWSVDPTIRGMSLPSRERGLKFDWEPSQPWRTGRSLHGSVD